MKKNIQMIRNVGGRLNYLIEGKNIIYQVTSHMLLKKKIIIYFIFAQIIELILYIKNFYLEKINAIGK